MDWRDRFRAGVVRAAARASRRPDRGVIVADHEGNDEAYAWDVETGALRKVSDSGTAVLEAAIRPDGASIVYHRDPTGSEFGHLHEAPFDGGASTDLTPDLPEYATYWSGTPRRCSSRHPGRTPAPRCGRSRRLSATCAVRASPSA